MQDYKHANNAQGILKVPISSSATTIQLETGQGGRFKSTFPYLLTLEQKNALLAVIKREIVKVTGRTGDLLTIVRSSGTCLPDDTSNTQGNQAFSFDAGTIISQYIPGEILEDIQAELLDIKNNQIPLKLSKAEYQAGSYVYGASSTGNDSYAITLPVSPGAYAIGQVFKFLADVGNTGAASLNINGLGAKTIKKLHDQDLVTGDIEAGQIVEVAYDGTNFQMNSQIATIPDVSTAKLTDNTLQAGESGTAGQAVCKKASDGKLYLTNASNVLLLNFVGFLEENMTLGSYPKITRNGINANQSGMTINGGYFLSNTPGAISTTPGTNVIYVGYAISTTMIYIGASNTPGLIANLPTKKSGANSVSYVAIDKYFTVNQNGYYSIQFTASTGGGTGSVAIYSNGTQLSQDFSAPSGAGQRYEYKTYLKQGDLVQFYGKGQNSSYAGAVEKVIINTVGQGLISLVD